MTKPKDIDEQFKGMAADEKYQAEAVKIEKQFAQSDWEALRCAECSRLASRVEELEKLVTGISAIVDETGTYGGWDEHSLYEEIVNLVYNFNGAGAHAEEKE